MPKASKRTKTRRLCCMLWALHISTRSGTGPFKEYYPEAWPTVQKYVAQGRWRPSGSWINAVDVNVPSPESLMRQALYGKRFFRHEFGVVTHDVYLPDCFGFGFALPSIAAHSGL